MRAPMPRHRGSGMKYARSKYGWWLYLALLLVVTADLACAATIRLVDQGAQVTVTFDGDIVAGDRNRLEQIAEQGLALGKPLGGIQLNSGGGNFAEAASIAESISMSPEAAASRPGAAAVVLPNRMCASACFLIFACAPHRYADVTSRIGVHSARNSNDHREDVGSYAVDTLAARIAKQCGVSDYLIGKMVTTPPDSMYWLTTQDLFAMGVHVWNNGSEPKQNQAGASQAQPQLPRQAATRATTLSDLHLRTAPDPRSTDVLAPPPNDSMPKGSQVTMQGRCQVWNGSGRGAQDADNVWCPVIYGENRGWANAYFLGNNSAERLACALYPTARGCGGTPDQAGTTQVQAPALPQTPAIKKCGAGPRLQVAGCIWSGYGPLYCLELRRQLEAADGCQW
jgi:hypothetical protein